MSGVHPDSHIVSKMYTLGYYGRCPVGRALLAVLAAIRKVLWNRRRDDLIGYHLIEPLGVHDAQDSRPSLVDLPFGRR